MEKRLEAGGLKSDKQHLAAVHRKQAKKAS